VFGGVPCENFKDKILVIQIANARQKILKEIWIHEKNIFSPGDRRKNRVKTEEHYEVL